MSTAVHEPTAGAVPIRRSPRRRGRKLVVVAIVVGVVAVALAIGATWFAHYQPLVVGATEGAGLQRAEFSNVDYTTYVDGKLVGIGYQIVNTGRAPIRIDDLHIDFPPVTLLRVDRMWLADPRGGSFDVTKPGPPAFPRTLGHGEQMIVFVRYRVGDCEHYGAGTDATYSGPMRFTTHVFGVSRHIDVPMSPLGVAIPSDYPCPRPRPSP